MGEVVRGLAGVLLSRVWVDGALSRAGVPGCQKCGGKPFAPAAVFPLAACPWSPQRVEGARGFTPRGPLSLGPRLPQQGTGSESEDRARVTTGPSLPSFLPLALRLPTESQATPSRPHPPTVLLAAGPRPSAHPHLA